MVTCQKLEVFNYTSPEEHTNFIARPERWSLSNDSVKWTQTAYMWAVVNQRKYVGSVFLGYEAVSLGKLFPTFLRYYIPSKRQERTTQSHGVIIIIIIIIII